MLDHLTSDTIIDYTHGELEPALDAAAHAHLSACPSCREDLAAELMLAERLKAAAQTSEREFPPGLRAAVFRAVSQPAPTPWWQLGRWLVPMVGVPALAAAAFALYVAGPGMHPAGHAGPTAVAASFYFDQHARSEADTPLADRGSAESELGSALGQGSVQADLTPPAAIAAASFIERDGP